MTALDTLIREAICDRLQLLCEASGLSQKEFARRIGITPQMLSNYFAALRTPGHAVIWRACSVTGQTPSDFYPPVVPAPKTRAISNRAVKRA